MTFKTDENMQSHYIEMQLLACCFKKKNPSLPFWTEMFIVLQPVSLSTTTC